MKHDTNVSVLTHMNTERGGGERERERKKNKGREGKIGKQLRGEKT